MSDIVSLPHITSLDFKKEFKDIVYTYREHISMEQDLAACPICVKIEGVVNTNSQWWSVLCWLYKPCWCCCWCPETETSSNLLGTTE
jgi:hypothetical protein